MVFEERGQANLLKDFQRVRHEQVWQPEHLGNAASHVEDVAVEGRVRGGVGLDEPDGRGCLLHEDVLHGHASYVQKEAEHAVVAPPGIACRDDRVSERR